jgi:hypothetical protein
VRWSIDRSDALSTVSSLEYEERSQSSTALTVLGASMTRPRFFAARTVGKKVGRSFVGKTRGSREYTPKASR